jgi:RNA polymerase II subunit A C-terminal domain phosphatase SSU72
MPSKYRYSVICSSNQNRSMEAHFVLSSHGFDVWSFGVGNNVRLPGPTAAQPNVYEFGTPYEYIYGELKGKNEDLSYNLLFF